MGTQQSVLWVCIRVCFAELCAEDFNIMYSRKINKNSSSSTTIPSFLPLTSSYSHGHFKSLS